jgi:sugar-specific transcriptional regulator TrmB
MTIFKIYLKNSMATKLSKPIKNYLTDFGLNDKEIELYMTLLKTGPSTIMDLSRESGIKRSTTHNNVEELIKKGLVSQTNYGERRMVVAEDPGKLQFLMEQKKWDLKKLEENMPDIVSLIKENVPETEKGNEVTVRYYIGEKEVKYVYGLSLKAEKVYSFVNLDNYYEVFPNTDELFVKALEENPKREVWDIAVDTPLARKIGKSHGRYYCKFIDPSKLFTVVDLLIFDNNLAIIQLEPGNTSATLIVSDQISKSLTSLHQSFWGLLPSQ